MEHVPTIQPGVGRKGNTSWVKGALSPGKVARMRSLFQSLIVLDKRLAHSCVTQLSLRLFFTSLLLQGFFLGNCERRVGWTYGELFPPKLTGTSQTPADPAPFPPFQRLPAFSEQEKKNLGSSRLCESGQSPWALELIT